MNIHNDHTATCLCCKYLSVTVAEEHYSEETPGASFEMYCFGGNIQFEHLSVDSWKGSYHDNLILATYCVFYEGKEE